MLGDFYTGALTVLVLTVGVGIPIGVVLTYILEWVISFCTCGDFKGSLIKETGRYGNDKLYFSKWKLNQVDVIGFSCVSVVAALAYSVILLAVSNKTDSTFLVNPLSEAISTVVALFLFIAINLFTVRVIYKLGRAVNTVKNNLKEHMEDKNAHG